VHVPLYPCRVDVTRQTTERYKEKEGTPMKRMETERLTIRNFDVDDWLELGHGVH